MSKVHHLWWIVAACFLFPSHCVYHFFPWPINSCATHNSASWKWRSWQEASDPTFTSREKCSSIFLGTENVLSSSISSVFLFNLERILDFISFQHLWLWCFPFSLLRWWTELVGFNCKPHCSVCVCLCVLNTYTQAPLVSHHLPSYRTFSHTLFRFHSFPLNVLFLFQDAMQDTTFLWVWYSFSTVGFYWFGSG